MKKRNKRGGVGSVEKKVTGGKIDDGVLESKKRVEGEEKKD